MLYCAYGSNLHPERLGQRARSARLAGTGFLKGWSLRFHKRGHTDGSAKCNIIPKPDAGGVHVAVYELADSELVLLDEIEGLGTGYDHKLLELPGYGGVLVYTAQASHVDEQLLPFEWYKAYVLAGCTHHGFDAEYVDAIRQVPHRSDPDRDRHEKHMSLINGMLKEGRRIA